MPLAYYMDENVPKAITVMLRNRGIDVLRAVEDGHKETDDDILLARAHALGRVMVSQDKDFLKMVSRCLLEGEAFSGVVYGPQQGASIGDYVEDLYLLAMVMEPADMMNNLQYLPL